MRSRQRQNQRAGAIKPNQAQRAISLRLTKERHVMSGQINTMNLVKAAIHRSSLDVGKRDKPHPGLPAMVIECAAIG